MIKIGLNMIGFIPGTIGGAETYFRNLLFHLQHIDHTNRYFILCDRKNAARFSLFNPLFETIEFNLSKPSLPWFIRGALKKTIGFDMLKPMLNHLELNIIHHPFTILNPKGLAFPSVLTFHDMQQEFYPEFFSRAILRFRKKHYRSSSVEATRIIAISGHVKQCLIDTYGINADKIDVVHTGCGPEYHQIEDADKYQKIKSRYRLSKPFIFYPAATWPHKNHKTLLSALRLLRDKYNFDGELVLTGTAMRGHNDVLREIKNLQLSDMVNVLGYIPENELPYIYNLARLLVFPSLFEGFGIPLVEAMACGCPVVCSNVTSIPEIAGDAALLFDPVSAEDMAAKIWRVWANEDEALRMKARGLEQSMKYNWEQTARKTIKIYEKAYSAS